MYCLLGAPYDDEALAWPTDWSRKWRSGAGDLSSPAPQPIISGPESKSHQERTTEVCNLIKALKPLTALVFVTRCAMRSRPGMFTDLGGTEFDEALTQYDISIRDAVALCRWDNWERRQTLARKNSGDERRRSQEKYRAPGIDTFYFANWKYS